MIRIIFDRRCYLWRRKNLQTYILAQFYISCFYERDCRRSSMSDSHHVNLRLIRDEGLVLISLQKPLYINIYSNVAENIYFYWKFWNPCWTTNIHHFQGIHVTSAVLRSHCTLRTLQFFCNLNTILKVNSQRALPSMISFFLKGTVVNRAILSLKYTVPLRNK